MDRKKLNQAFIKRDNHWCNKKWCSNCWSWELTSLRPDWSKQGLGYFLLQKHCKCNSWLPDCCTISWKVTLAGSSFLNGAEKNYAAIEGESLAISWSLELTKYFTKGCKILWLLWIHKPLVNIFADCALNKIQNTHIFRFKQRKLPWFFKVHYMTLSNLEQWSELIW